MFWVIARVRNGVLLGVGAAGYVMALD